MLSSRAKIIFLKDFFINPRDVMKYNNNEIRYLLALGSIILAEIIGRLKTYYGILT
jgi:hypothetical protein